MPAPLALIENGLATNGRVVALRGEIDVGSTPALREWLSRASEGGRESLTVDLSHVDFMAVSGLYVLCDEQARMARHRAQLTIVCASPRMLQLFEVCRLGDVLRIAPARIGIADDMWGLEDDQRTERLEAWLERYAAGSAGAANAPGAPAAPDSSSSSPPPAAS